MTIKHVIDASNKTRYQISKETGIRKSALHRLYHGTVPLENTTFGTIEKLSKCLGYKTIDDFVKTCRLEKQ